MTNKNNKKVKKEILKDFAEKNKDNLHELTKSQRDAVLDELSQVKTRKPDFTGKSVAEELAEEGWGTKYVPSKHDKPVNNITDNLPKRKRGKYIETNPYIEQDELETTKQQAFEISSRKEKKQTINKIIDVTKNIFIWILTLFTLYHNITFNPTPAVIISLIGYMIYKLFKRDK